MTNTENQEKLDNLDNTETFSENEQGPCLEKKKKTLLHSLARILLWIFILSLLLFFIPLPYMFEAPGSCEDTSQFVKVAGVKHRKTLGKFYLTTVIYERANGFLYLWGIMDKSTELTPLKNTRYNGTSSAQYNSSMQGQMENSKMKAKIAAFRALGYKLDVKRKPVEIVFIAPWSKAASLLKLKDKIMAINGTPITCEEALSEILKKVPKGENPTFTLQRGDRTFDLKIPLTEYKGDRLVGIIISCKIESVKFPKKVEIESKNIIGASAGLMFTLEIMKQVSGVDLTGGYQISGTGVIDDNGKVYPIEGVRFKVIAAERRGTTHFLVPARNYKDAKAAATTIEVHSVKDLQEALEVLKKLNSTATIEDYKVKENQKTPSY